MKFDCVKVSGKLDFVHVVSPIKNAYQTTIGLDGVTIPNLLLPSTIYEELEPGENVTIFGMFKNLKKKEKNDGVAYGILKEDGQRIYATNTRYVVPAMMLAYAALAFCIVFVAGWAASCLPIAYLLGSVVKGSFFLVTTVVACIEAGLVAAFFIWRAWLYVKFTNDPESWKAIEPSVLSSRFSKFHK